MHIIIKLANPRSNCQENKWHDDSIYQSIFEGRFVMSSVTFNHEFITFELPLQGLVTHIYFNTNKTK